MIDHGRQVAPSRRIKPPDRGRLASYRAIHPIRTVQQPSAIEDLKVSAPILREVSVDKAAVIAGLVASSRPFTAVIAPAGYGKTTLAVRWASTDPRPFAWLCLDDRDNDRLVFLRGIAAAIDRIEPVSDEVFGGPAPNAEPDETMVTRLGSAFARLKQPIVLALDDLHAVTDPACLATLSSLLDYVPAGSQVVLLSRERPALPLARWRARGLLDEVATSDLRLDPGEADRLLRGAGVALEPSDVADLTERTEGWPAGLYLSALSLRSGLSVPTSVRDVSGRDRFLSEYLRLEVLSRLDADEVDFLLRSSILEHMTGPLCDSVLETTGSAIVLDRLADSNRFVVPLDHEGHAYRYHHMFRQLLQDELQRSKPEAGAALNRRAMLWCMVNEEPDLAARYADAAGDTGDTGEVAQLVDRLASSMSQDGRSETVDTWLGWLEAADLATQPARVADRASIRASTGPGFGSERHLSVAEHAAGTERIGGWAVRLTAAELRLLPYLATQLKFPEISSQLFITTHTVKSEAQHIYRKLDVSSRTEAIERAVELGLLEPMFPLRTKLAG